MSTNAVIALGSIVTGLGATAAAVVAAAALRAQQRSQQRQHDLENLRWLTDQYAGLRESRRRAAAGFLDDSPDEEAVWQVLNYWERCAHLVRERFLTEEAFTKRISGFAVVGWWIAAEAMIRAVRERMGAELVADFEWLCDRMRTPELDSDGVWLESFLRFEAGRPILDAEARADPQGSDASN